MRRRSHLLPALFYLVVTVALVWPLFPRFATGIPHDAGDPVLNTWLLWWSSRAVPLTDAWWNAPMFHPSASVMALSEVLIGLLPMTLPIQWLTGQPQLAYNVAFVLSFPLCGLSAYALAFELTGRRDASAIAGLAFMLAPYRMGQLAHLQMLAYYGAPLVFVGLHRFRRTGARSALFLFGGAWLLQSLTNGYAIFHLGIAIAAWLLWFARSRRLAVPLVSAWAVASLPLVPVLLKYREVQSSLHLARSINDIKSFGAGPADFLAVASDLLVWGGRLLPPRAEMTLFPGVTVLAAGLAGSVLLWRRRERLTGTRPRDWYLWIAVSAVAILVALSASIYGPWRLGPLSVSEFRKPLSLGLGALLLAAIRSDAVRRAWRRESVVAFYLVLLAGAYLLALGPEPRLFDRPLLYEPPYAWLMRLPGFDGIRVPARFAMIGVLAQSALLAILLSRSWIRARAFLVAGVAAGVLLEGWVVLFVAAPPAAGPSIREFTVGAIAELPLGDLGTDFGAVYRGMTYPVPIVNGYSGYAPPHYLPLAHALRDGRYDALQGMVAPGRALGLVVDTASVEGARIATALVATGMAERVVTDRSWTTFIVPSGSSLAGDQGRRLPPAAVAANQHPEDVGRMLDGRVDTAWGSSGDAQRGDEELIVDLGAPRSLGSVVMKLGPYAFGFPRRLTIETSDDHVIWTTAWAGPTNVATVQAAVRDPANVPLRIDLAAVSGRYLRLKQNTAEAGNPWWIAELEIYERP